MYPIQCQIIAQNAGTIPVGGINAQAKSELTYSNDRIQNVFKNPNPSANQKMKR